MKRYEETGDTDYSKVRVIKRGVLERIKMAIIPKYHGNTKGNNEHSASAGESGVEAVGPSKPLGYYPIPEEVGEEGRKKLILLT